MAKQRSERLRAHPRERFAERQQEFTLEAVAARLRKEPQAGEAGHRQQTLYRLGPMSVSMFVFDRLTRLAPHRINGVALIQVLKGRLQVTADGHAHNLDAGRLLVLAPGVEHDVVAQQESEMLLTVHLDAPPAPAPERPSRPDDA